jgi:hypothetical protein
MIILFILFKFKLMKTSKTFQIVLRCGVELNKGHFDHSRDFGHLRPAQGPDPEHSLRHPHDCHRRQGTNHN